MVIIKILDVGTVKSDKAWIAWLKSLQIEVYVVDYDTPDSAYQNIHFYRAYVRKLPIPYSYFNKVLAVSVIERIGLEKPQIKMNNLPTFRTNVDIEAISELARVLKPGGELIMTFPFGKKMD